MRNIKNMDVNILKRIGLSLNEIKVYTALIELEKSTATKIVKKARIPNSKVYPVLDKLINKGLVSYTIKNNVKHFQPTSPENLLEIIERKEKELEEQKKEIKKIIKYFEKKLKNEERQEAFIYEGYNGVKSAFDRILNSLKKGEEYYVLTLGKELGEKQLRLFFMNYHKKRMKRGIKVKLIANKRIREIFLKHHVYKGMEVRFTELKLPTGIFIYKNSIMTVVWGKNPTAFVIDSKQNARRYKEFFREMWKLARR